jgi:hypothetical protein
MSLKNRISALEDELLNKFSYEIVITKDNKIHKKRQSNQQTNRVMRIVIRF